MAKHKLTDRQREVLEFIKNFSFINGCSPSYPEIAKEFNISLRPAQKHVERLYVKGYITKLHGITRGIVVLHDHRN